MFQAVNLRADRIEELRLTGHYSILVLLHSALTSPAFTGPQN